MVSMMSSVLLSTELGTKAGGVSGLKDSRGSSVCVSVISIVCVPVSVVVPVVAVAVVVELIEIFTETS